MKQSAMARETQEAGDALRRLLAQAGRMETLARTLDWRQAPLAVICGRGSSGNAGVFLRYLIETRLGLPVSMTAPSVTTALNRPLRLRGALFITISQSGASPDLVAATRAAREAGAATIALVNAANSPLGVVAEHVVPLAAGPETSVAATKSVTNSMAAGALLVAALGGDMDLRAAMEQLPARLDAANGLDWSSLVPALAAAQNAFITSRGLGLGTAREVALKMTETLRIPALGYSAAELLHGPRAAISAQSFMLGLRLGDATARDVDTVLATLAAQGLSPAHCGNSTGSLPWIGDGHPAADAIAHLVPAYRLIEQAARLKAYDPDNPPNLSKVTLTL